VTDALDAARDDDFCYVTTRGRVTGRPHEIEIWFVLDGATVFLLSGGGDRSDWVRNLIADPAVSVRLRDVTCNASARVIDPASEEDARARRLVFEKYQPRYDGILTSWRERSLPVALDLVQLPGLARCGAGHPRRGHSPQS
jgi:deazaflavin-dependent oxidoreductase (nitroreductase family)